MRNKLKFLAVFFLLISIVGAQNTVAQDNEGTSMSNDTAKAEYNKWYIGAMIGAPEFYGDVADLTHFPGDFSFEDKFSWIGGIRGGLEFNQWFGLRANFKIGRLSAVNNSYSFYSDIRDLSLQLTVNMTTLVAPYRFNKKWYVSPYVGIGSFGYRGIYQDEDGNIEGSVGYDEDGNKDKLKYNSLFNYGIDVAYKLNKSFDIFLNIGFNSTPIDNLDAKPVYLSELDRYSQVAIGVNYTFGKNDDAYKWNPKPSYLQELEDEMVDMGERITDNEEAIAELRKINPCDTSTVDSDNDQVPDCRDLEVNSPEGAIVNFQGIALISAPDENGERRVIPVPEKKSYPIIFFSPVYFEYDKDIIDSTGEFDLINVAIYLKRYPEAKILISGNCDVRGTDDYNDELSTRRCDKVKKILVESYGIDASRLETQPNGKRYILFPKQHHANRRVDVTVVEE